MILPVFRCLSAIPVEFRWRVDGLMALVRDAGADHCRGALYVRQVKIVWWTGTGASLFAERLDEKGQF